MIGDLKDKIKSALCINSRKSSRKELPAPPQIQIPEGPSEIKLLHSSGECTAFHRTSSASCEQHSLKGKQDRHQSVVECNAQTTGRENLVLEKQNNTNRIEQEIDSQQEHENDDSQAQKVHRELQLVQDECNIKDSGSGVVVEEEFVDKKQNDEKQEECRDEEQEPQQMEEHGRIDEQNSANDCKVDRDEHFQDGEDICIDKSGEDLRQLVEYHDINQILHKTGIENQYQQDEEGHYNVLARLSNGIGDGVVNVLNRRRENQNQQQLLQQHPVTIVNPHQESLDVENGESQNDGNHNQADCVDEDVGQIMSIEQTIASTSNYHTQSSALPESSSLTQTSSWGTETVQNAHLTTKEHQRNQKQEPKRQQQKLPAQSRNEHDLHCVHEIGQHQQAFQQQQFKIISQHQASRDSHPLTHQHHYHHHHLPHSQQYQQVKSKINESYADEEVSVLCTEQSEEEEATTTSLDRTLCICSVPIIGQKFVFRDDTQVKQNTNLKYNSQDSIFQPGPSSGTARQKENNVIQKTMLSHRTKPKTPLGEDISCPGMKWSQRNDINKHSIRCNEDCSSLQRAGNSEGSMSTIIRKRSVSQGNAAGAGLNSRSIMTTKMNLTEEQSLSCGNVGKPFVSSKVRLDVTAGTNEVDEETHFGWDEDIKERGMIGELLVEERAKKRKGKKDNMVKRKSVDRVVMEMGMNSVEDTSDCKDDSGSKNGEEKMKLDEKLTVGETAVSKGREIKTKANEDTALEDLVLGDVVVDGGNGAIKYDGGVGDDDDDDDDDEDWESDVDVDVGELDNEGGAGRRAGRLNNLRGKIRVQHKSSESCVPPSSEDRQQDHSDSSTLGVDGEMDVFKLKGIFGKERHRLNKNLNEYRRNEKKISSLCKTILQLKREAAIVCELKDRSRDAIRSLQQEVANQKALITAACDVKDSNLSTDTARPQRLESVCYQRYCNIKTVKDADSLSSLVKNKQNALNDLTKLIQRKRLALKHELPVTTDASPKSKLPVRIKPRIQRE